MELAVSITMVVTALWFVFLGLTSKAGNLFSAFIMRILPGILAVSMTLSAFEIISVWIQVQMWTSVGIMLYIGVMFRITKGGMRALLLFKICPVVCGLAQIVCVLKYY